jgi:hypothetical protein
MAWNLPADASRDRSILLIMARLLKAGKADWLATDEAKGMIERLEMPESKKIAYALIDRRKKRALSASEKDDLSYIEQLAGL